jgi:hypothetical protein
MLIASGKVNTARTLVYETPPLGSGWRPFKKARAFVRDLGCKSQVEWFDYCTSGKKPTDIPSNPTLAYAGKGWLWRLARYR